MRLHEFAFNANICTQAIAYFTVFYTYLSTVYPWTFAYKYRRFSHRKLTLELGKYIKEHLLSYVLIINTLSIYYNIYCLHRLFRIFPCRLFYFRNNLVFCLVLNKSKYTLKTFVFDVIYFTYLHLSLKVHLHYCLS
jgi:hypothetical protein